MRENKKSEGGAFKAPPPPDRIGLKSLTVNNFLINKLTYKQTLINMVSAMQHKTLLRKRVHVMCNILLAL